MKKTDRRQSRQIGGLKTQDKFIRERLVSLESKVQILCLVVGIFFAVIIAGIFL